MRKWDRPEIAMLDLNQTKSGVFWSPVETHVEYHGIFINVNIDAGPGDCNHGGEPTHGGGSETGGKDAGNTPNTRDTNAFS